MDDRKLVSPTQLSVSIEGAEFAKDFNYFVTVQLDGQSEKRRTDVSARVKNPVFTANTFYLPLPSNRIELNQRLLFAVFVVTERQGDLGRGQARLLGDCTLELGPLAAALTDVRGAGIRQHLRFIRTQEGKQVNVGRFLVQLKLIPQGEMPDVIPGGDELLYHPLPVADPSADFVWRVRVDFRCALDVPMSSTSSSSLPSPYMEFGWSHYSEQRPADNDVIRSVVVQRNKHPVWNQQVLFINPPAVTSIDGFLWLTLRDQSARNSIETITIPTTALRGFHPVHLEMLGTSMDFDNRPRLFVSLVFEEAISASFTDSLIDIAIHAVNFDPLPMATNKVMVVMTTHGYELDDLPLTTVDLLGDSNLSSELMKHKNMRQSIFMTPILSVAPTSADNPYGAQAIFTVPKTFLDSQLSFYLIVRDDSLLSNNTHPMPNTIVGHTEIVDDDLQTSLYAKREKELYLPVIWEQGSAMYPLLTQTKCTLQLTVHSLESQDESRSIDRTHIQERSFRAEPERRSQLAVPYQSLKGSFKGAPAPEGADDLRGKWEVMSREFQQKQELVHRLMRENDEKSDALKLTGSEIIELRRQIKLLQSENAILRKRLNEEEQIDLAAVVTKEIERMNHDELKSKIIKIAQMYRSERMRNEEFEKVIQSAHREVSEAYRFKGELETLAAKHEETNRKLQKTQSLAEKSNMYRETVKKQERVIAKMEGLLEKTLKDTQQAREAATMLEKLKTENLELRKQMRSAALGMGSTSVEAAQREVRRLETLVEELQEQLRSKRPVTGDQHSDWEREKMELEIQLQKAELRVSSMQEEMDTNAVKFAKEISHYKALLAEKQSLIDTMQGEYQ